MKKTSIFFWPFQFLRAPKHMVPLSLILEVRGQTLVMSRNHLVLTIYWSLLKNNDLPQINLQNFLISSFFSPAITFADPSYPYRFLCHSVLVCINLTAHTSPTAQTHTHTNMSQPWYVRHANATQRMISSHSVGWASHSRIYPEGFETYTPTKPNHHHFIHSPKLSQYREAHGGF